jgi:hypothetical protein
MGGTPILTNSTINSTGIMGGGPTIANCTINGRITVGTEIGIDTGSMRLYGEDFAHSSPVFVGNTFLDGIDLYGAQQATIINNLFMPTGNSAIFCQMGNVSISNNTIVGADKNQTGIKIQNIVTFVFRVDPSTKTLQDFQIVQANGSFTITGNHISNCQSAINASHGNIAILKNTLIDNAIGISINSRYYALRLDPDIRTDNTTLNIHENTITENSIGIQYDSTPAFTSSIFSDITELANVISNGRIVAYLPVININYNNIYDNAEYNFKQYRSNYTSVNSVDVTATNNWWGTTDSNAISRTIYDYKNDNNLGTVTYTPYLTAPTTNSSLLTANNTLIVAAIAGACVIATLLILLKRTKRKI